MAKITNDARKKAIKAAKEKGIQIPRVQLQSVEFVGNVTFANRIYDYISIDGLSYPLVSAYGYFKVKDSEDVDTHLVVKEWRILPFLDFPRSRLSWSPVLVNHDVGLLMHWPNYREHIRKAKLGLLFAKVKARIKVYIKFENQNLYDAVTLWILASHFNRIFNHFPILDLFKAGYNAGGSVAMKTIISYCPRPMLVQDPTEASLFRSVNDFRPTVGIEEFTTDMDEDKRKAILTLLDGAFDKSVKIARTDNKIVKGYDFFGPKVIVDPQAQISRYSTSSRTLFAPLINSPGFNSDPDTIVEHDKELIQTLYDSFIVYAKRIDKAYRSCRITGDGRIDQAFRPLLAVAMVLRIEGIDVIDNLIKVLQEQFQRREMIKSEGDISKQILTAVYEIVSNDESRNAWFTERKDGSQIFYLRTSNLRNAISNWLGIEFQSDKSKNNGVRYWKKPPKEIAEILQDGRRFSALLSTFLYDNVGNVEPGSRHLCLFYTRTPSTLIDRLILVIGFRPTESHNSPNVGYQVDTLFSEILNKKNKKFPQKRIVSIGRDELIIERRRGLPRNVGNFGEFFFLNPLISASACNPTMWCNVGNCGSRVEEQNKLTDSTNSGIPSENTITERKGREVTDSLLKDGIRVNPKDSGPSIDRRFFKIAIPTPRGPEKLALLKVRMSSLGFTQANSGAHGTLFFVRPLSSEVQP